jgi:hypothetical protein
LPGTDSPNRLGDQIVIRVADDFDFGEFANGQLAPHINPTVNVRRVRFAASDKKVTSGE